MSGNKIATNNTVLSVPFTKYSYVVDSLRSEFSKPVN